MNVFDLYNSSSVANALSIAAISSSGNNDGVIIDTAGFEGLTFLIQSATLTDGTYTAQLFDGDAADLSDAAQVSSDLVLGSAVFAAADDNTAKRIGYIGKKRYVRLRIVSADVTTGGTLGATALLTTAHHMPVANQ